MERLTHDADFGFEDWEETLFFVKSDPNGAYNILDIARFQGEAEFDEILKNIALRLAAYEDTGFTPEEVQQMRWIPVEERLPEKHSEYIVCACDEGEPIDERIWGDTVVVCADYYDGGFTWYEGNTEYDISDIVTHWMPLPEPPKEASHD